MQLHQHAHCGLLFLQQKETFLFLYIQAVNVDTQSCTLAWQNHREFNWNSFLWESCRESITPKAWYIEKLQCQPVVLCKMWTLKSHKVWWRSESVSAAHAHSQSMAGFQKSIEFSKINVMIRVMKLFAFLECWSIF